MSEFPEAGGVAWTKVYTVDGLEVTLTARKENLRYAIDDLAEQINYVKKYKWFHEKPGSHRKPAATHPLPPPEEFPFDVPEEVLEAEKEPIMGRDWGVVKYPPKAKELKWGDRYEIEVTQYKYGDGSIKFYTPDSQWNVLEHNMKNEYTINKFMEVFKGWEPEPDDDKHPIPRGAVVLQIQCTGPDKPTKAGNPYQNLDGMRRP